MRVVPTITIDDAELDSTNVTNDHADWASGTTYNTGDRVVYQKEVWEALQTSTGSAPGTDANDWLRIRYSNTWRMFREGRDSQTTATGDIDVTLIPGETINTVGALGLEGFEITLTVTDATDGVVYNETKPLVDIGVESHWDWHFAPYRFFETVVFDGIPPYPDADYRLFIEASGASEPVACGRVAMGLGRDLGVTNYGTSVEVQDYSTKQRDEFGTLELVPRRTITLVDYDVTVDSNRVDTVVRLLRGLGGTPALYVGEPDQYQSTVTYGVFRNVVQGIDAPSISDLTLQVEEF